MANRARIGTNFAWAAAVLVALSPANARATSPDPVADEFWWGLATSSFQTEDASEHFDTDWDLFHAAGRLHEPRGEAAFAYTQTARDIAALVAMGVDSYRFGVEWARIEPEPGTFDSVAIDHYATFARDLKAAGIEPIVCLWHFTFPSWATNLEEPYKHGWFNPTAMERWPAYVAAVGEALGPHVRWWAPQNEPNGVAMAGYFLGLFPPGVAGNLLAYRAQVDASAQYFIRAAQILRDVDPDAKIVSVQNVISWQRAWWDVFATVLSIGLDYNHHHLDLIADELDMVGFNYYYQREATLSPSAEVAYPAGLYEQIAVLARRYGKPVAVMENGIGTDDDAERIAFMDAHVREVQRARADGHDVRGYFFWSLVDNYEWALGYSKKYGLHTLDPKTRALVPKPSAKRFADLAGGGDPPKKDP